jgi:hypothetical protein
MHSFDPVDAEKFGILEAILLSNIRWWVNKNTANNKHFHDGCYWTYNSAKAFTKLFPYASQQQIQRALKKLEDGKVIKVGNFNSNPYDHTKWFAMGEFDVIDSSYLIKREVSDDQPSNTVIKPVVKKVGVDNEKFNAFWTAYPRKSNKAFARKSFDKLNPDDVLLQKILNAIHVQRRSIWLDKDPQYIPHPSTWLNGERWEDEVTVAQIKPNGLAGAI